MHTDGKSGGASFDLHPLNSCTMSPLALSFDITCLYWGCRVNNVVGTNGANIDVPRARMVRTNEHAPPPSMQEPSDPLER